MIYLYLSKTHIFIFYMNIFTNYMYFLYYKYNSTFNTVEIHRKFLEMYTIFLINQILKYKIINIIYHLSLTTFSKINR